MSKMQTENQRLNPGAKENKPRGRWMLLLLFIFFAAPLIVVTVMHKVDWHPAGFSRGQMVTPARQISMPAGAADLWKEKWSMVYIADVCDETCASRLHDMRQLHSSLAKNIERVQRILVTSDADVSGLKQKYPDLIIINQPEAGVSALKRQFDLADSTAGSAERVYLVDPLGYLMMSYPINMAASDIRKDLSRLLTYAWAG
ncbi:hypothetical protein MTYP_00150 [Methylophilaceae bacterium]|nr:hypothetical protein MTYP_00150 [Methylophilaceae bacterium]